MSNQVELHHLLLEEIKRKKFKRPFGLLLSGGVDSGLLAALTKPDIVTGRLALKRAAYKLPCSCRILVSENK